MTTEENNKILDKITEEIKEEMKEHFSKMNLPRILDSFKLKTKNHSAEDIYAYLNNKEMGMTNELIELIKTKLKKEFGSSYKWDIAFYPDYNKELKQFTDSGHYLFSKEENP